MHRPLVAAVVCFLALGTVFGASPVIANGGYSISQDSGIDIPTRDLTFEGSDYEISAIGTTSPDGTFEVTTSGPDGEEYDLYLYNNDRQIVDSKNNLDGQTTSSFTVVGGAGTYFVIIDVDGQYQEIQPTVAEAYQVDLSVPEEATAGDSVQATVEVTQHSDAEESLEFVDVVLSIDGEDQTIRASQNSDGEYTATLDLSDTGTYIVYAGARGSDRVEGEYELIGVSTRATIDVEAETTTDSNDGGGGGGGTGPSGGGGTGGGQTTETPTQSPTETVTNGTTVTESNVTTTTGTSESETETSTTTARTTATTEGESGTTATTDDSPTRATTAQSDRSTDGEQAGTGTDRENVVTPAGSTETEGQTTTDGTGPVPLAGILSSLLLCLGGVRLWRLLR